MQFRELFYLKNCYVYNGRGYEFVAEFIPTTFNNKAGLPL